MWAYAMTRPRHLERVQAPTPDEADLRDGYVLLRTLAGAVCGSDLATYQGLGEPRPQFQGVYAPNYPGYPMHEVAGEVLASRDPTLPRGALVVGWARNTDAIAEYVVTQGESLVQVDLDLDPARAVLIQSLACVIEAADRIGVVEGQRVAVLGVGPIGALFSHILKSRGAAHVTAVDLVDRSDIATDFGIDEVVCGSTERWAMHLGEADRPNLVVEAIGHQHVTLGDAIDGVAAGGRIYYFGIPDRKPVSFDLHTFLRKALRLDAGTTKSYRQSLEAAREHLKANRFLADVYVTHIFEATDVDAAYAAAARPMPGQLKVAVRLASDTN